MYRLKWPVLWLAIAWSMTVALVYLSLAPLAVPNVTQGGDKYAHVAAYAALMFCFMQIYGSARPRVAIACGLAAMGIALEFLQGYTGYRTYERADMAANVLG